MDERENPISNWEKRLDTYLARREPMRVGGITANAFCEKFRACFFQQALAFWNHHRPNKPWHPQPDDDPFVYKNSRYLIKLGLHLYRRAHPGSSNLPCLFSDDAVIFLGEASQSANAAERMAAARRPTQEEAHLSQEEWSQVTKSISREAALSARNWIRWHVTHGDRMSRTLSLEDANELARRKGLATFSPVIDYKACKLPNREWLDLNVAVTALALGEPNPYAEEPELTEELAAASLAAILAAAGEGHIHCYGYRRLDLADEHQRERIESHLDWATAESNWYHNTIRIKRRLHERKSEWIWIKVQITTETMRAWLKTRTGETMLAEKSKNRGGRTPTYDWPKVERIALGILEEEGPPDPKTDRGWTRTEFADRIADAYADQDAGKQAPHQSQIMKKIDGYIETWRGMRKAS